VKFFKPKFNEIDITKEIAGIKFPINATTFAKVAAAEILREKFNELFKTQTYDIIVLPAKNLDIDKLKTFVADKNCIIDNLFKGNFKHNDLVFNSNSITLHFIDDLNIYKFAKSVIKEFNLKGVLVYFNKNYSLKIISLKS